MKKLLMATVFAFGFSSVALAADPMKQDSSGIYVGGSVGGGSATKDRVNLGANVGYQIGSNVRVEADFDHAFHTKGSANMVMGNVIAQVRLPDTLVVPYVMTGVGFGYSNFANVKTGEVTPLFDVGTGVRVAVSKNVELDVRYRLVRPIEIKNAGTNEENIFSAGLSYKF